MVYVRAQVKKLPRLPHSQGAKPRLTNHASPSQLWAQTVQTSQLCAPAQPCLEAPAMSPSIQLTPLQRHGHHGVRLSPSTGALGTSSLKSPRLLLRASSAEPPQCPCAATALDQTGAKPGHIHPTHLAQIIDAGLLQISVALKKLTMHSSCLTTAKGCERVYTKELLQQRIYTLRAHVSSDRGLFLHAALQPVLKHAPPALLSLRGQAAARQLRRRKQP